MNKNAKTRDARILKTVEKLKRAIDLWHVNVTTLGNQDAWSDSVLEEILKNANELGVIYYEEN